METVIFALKYAKLNSFYIMFRAMVKKECKGVN